jgi:predicted XRE-type DNA-binding protein
MSDDTAVHTVENNLFEELALPDAAELSPRVDLAFILTQEIRSRNLTQAKAAALLGISQPDVSNLMRGNVDGFSQERLERLLNKLDLDVRIQVSRRPRGKGERGWRWRWWASSKWFSR